jgi:hypothetical protein
MTDPAPRSCYEVFSSATNSISGSTPLWRYLTFERFVWMVDNASLYHARLDQLEDRFEGSVTRHYAENRGMDDAHTGEHRRKIEPLFNRRYLVCSYVNCWHAAGCESAAMWKLYSRLNAGVAITSTVKRLQESVTLPRDAESGTLGPVEYFDFAKDPMCSLTGSRVRPGYAKQKSFEYEREVRCMICINPDRESTGFTPSEEYLTQLKARTPLGLYAHVDLKGLIEKIFTSPLSPPWFNKIVESAAGRVGLGDVVVESSLNGDPIY